MRRTLPLALVVAALVATSWSAIAGSAGAAPAATAGACPDASGITVVVDFQELGGGVVVRCAPGPVSSGFDALAKAGFQVVQATRRPGFLCRIDGKPGVDRDPCVDTSPASAYWGYWLAHRGGDWCYSNLGAGGRKPPAGTVEGWSFSQDHTADESPPPRFGVPAPLPGTTPATVGHASCPSEAPPPTPTTQRSTPVAVVPEPGGSSPSTIGSTAPAGGDEAPPPPSTGASSGSANPTSTAPDSTTSTGPAGAVDPLAAATTTTATADRAGDADEVAAEPAGSRSGGGGRSPVGAAVAAGVAALLAGGAFVLARRRGGDSSAG